MKHRKSSQLLQQLVFVGPSIVFFILIIVVPFLLGMYYSFTDWNGVSENINWVGFDNFIHILRMIPSSKQRSGSQYVLRWLV